jgi:hypothetical protein
MTKKLPFKVVQNPVGQDYYIVTSKGFIIYITRETWWKFAPQYFLGKRVPLIEDPKVASDILWSDYCYQTIGEFPELKK